MHVAKDVVDEIGIVAIVGFDGDIVFESANGGVRFQGSDKAEATAGLAVLRREQFDFQCIGGRRAVEDFIDFPGWRVANIFEIDRLCRSLAFLHVAEIELRRGQQDVAPGVHGDYEGGSRDKLWPNGDESLDRARTGKLRGLDDDINGGGLFRFERTFAGGGFNAIAGEPHFGDIERNGIDVGDFEAVLELVAAIDGAEIVGKLAAE